MQSSKNINQLQTFEQYVYIVGLFIHPESRKKPNPGCKPLNVKLNFWHWSLHYLQNCKILNVYANFLIMISDIQIAHNLINTYTKPLYILTSE